MDVKIMVLCAVIICLVIGVMIQRVYIYKLEEKIRCARTEARWTCGDCENAEYILKAVD